MAGRADSGYIRKNSVRCQVAGAEYVGGVAGTAATVSDCRSLVQFDGGAEKVGGVLGSAEEVTESIEDNYYLPVGGDCGGIDGISYEGKAQALDSTAFFKLKKLPEDFAQVQVRFLFEDGSEKTVTVDYGAALPESKIPAVPEKDDGSGHWDGLSETDLSALYFDMTFEAVYDAYETVLASEAVRADGRPILLASSEFGSGAAVTLEELPTGPVSVSEGETIAESWSFTLTAAGSSSKLRYLPAEDLSAEELLEDEAEIMVRDASGAWRTVSYTVDGSYLVFEVAEGDTGFCLVQSEGLSWMVYGLISVGVLVVLEGIVIVWVLIRKRNLGGPKPID